MKMTSFASLLSLAMVSLLIQTTEGQEVNLLPSNILNISQLLQLQEPLHLEVGSLTDGQSLNLPINLTIDYVSLVPDGSTLLNLTIVGSLDIGNASIPIRLGITLGNLNPEKYSILFPIRIILEIGNQVIPVVINWEDICNILQAGLIPTIDNLPVSIPTLPTPILT